MIRTTYRGRAIKVLAARGNPFRVRTFINGKILSHGWDGTDVQALDWFRQIIDKLDASGGPGNSAEILRNQYTEPHWWEPGTFDINPQGHATQPGGVCLCSTCVIGDIGTGKARYAPLQPNACQHCHQGPDDHNPSPLSVSREHPYTEPTPQQRAGRQATIDEYHQLDEDDDEATCDALYPEKVRDYLSRPKCFHFVDHRDAENPAFHTDHRGFRWPKEA